MAETIATGAETPSPIQVPQPIAASPTAIATAPQVTETGGGGGGFFSSLDWVEVGFGILGATALYFVIYYYKNKTVFEKTEKSQLQQQIDSLKTQLKDLEKGNNTENYVGGF